MIGVGYTGGYQAIVPQIKIKNKFAWWPVCTVSGKWLWRCNYVKLETLHWGPSGEGPAVDVERYTENEWLLESVKNNYASGFKNPPPKK